MNINLNTGYIYFNADEPSIAFKFTMYTPFDDLKFILEELLSYDDNQKIVKLEYRSPSADNEGNIEFNNFEFKTTKDVRALRNIFFHYENNFLIELDAKIERFVEDIVRMLERPHRR